MEILKFSAPWCNSCTAYNAVIKSWKNKQKTVSILDIDVDTYPEEGAKYKIMSIPTTILMRDGIEVKRQIWPMSVNELDNFIK